MSTAVDVFRSAFSMSAKMELIPAAFPVFKALMAFLTSDFVGGSVLMLKTTSAGGELARTSGSAPLSSSRKCCTNRTAYSRSVVRVAPSLSLTGEEWVVFFPRSLFGDPVNNTHFTFSSCGSASPANSSTKDLLPLLALLSAPCL